MDNTMNTDAIENLASFAFAQSELPFGHLCTAALQGEEWAQERLADVVAVFETNGVGSVTLAAIKATDTTRPDGSIARSFQP